MVSFTLLAGSYTSAISAFSFNAASSTLSLLSQSPAGSNPSWLALHPFNHSIVFATNEGTNGSLLSFTVGPLGALNLIGNISSAGADPAYAAVLSDGKEVVVMDYSSGTGLPIALRTDGVTFDKPAPVLTFTGSGPNLDRQASSHPHEVVEYKDAFGNTELLVPDLGADKVRRLSRKNGNWVETGAIVQKAGSGPRHIVAQNSLLWTVCELDNTLYQHTLPPLVSSTQPKLIKSVSVLDPARPANSTYGAAELQISPINPTFPIQYLYASNRNVSPNPAQIDPRGDTIAIIEPLTLTVIKQVPTGLQQIRGMTIGGDKGQYIAAAGLTGGGVAVFERVSGGRDLKLLARYNGTGSASVTGFVWL